MPREDDEILATDHSHLTYREWHAFVNGGYIGLVGYPERANVRHVDELDCSCDDQSKCCRLSETNDKHYWRLGFLLGWAIKVTGILAVGNAVIT